MRRAFSISGCVLATLFVCGPALSSEQVVLKDGRSISLSKPYVVKGNQAILTTTEGTLLSVRLSEIDMDKTAAAKNPAPVRVAEAPEKAATKPQSPAEAARMKGTKKATVVVNDEDVSHPVEIGGGDSKSDSEGDGRVEVTNVSAVKRAGGYTVTGSVFNSGKGPVSGVSVTVEAVGASNETVTSGFGHIAKDRLTAGEKSEFTAEIATEADIQNFRALPRWQVQPKAEGPKASVKTADGAKAGAAGDGTEPAASPTPAPAPAAKKTPTYVPRPDYAAPPANVPVGAPTTPGGGYIPGSTTDQARPLATPPPPSAP